MKRKLCLIMALVFVCTSVCSTTASASDISLCNNNTMAASMIFTISDSGLARITLNYEGYPNITTGATITIKIEKRTLLLFWSDIVDDTISVTGESYFDELTYQLEDTGTYRCTVEYVISGTGGADDVLTFEDTKTYE